MMTTSICGILLFFFVGFLGDTIVVAFRSIEVLGDFLSQVRGGGDFHHHHDDARDQSLKALWEWAKDNGVEFSEHICLDRHELPLGGGSYYGIAATEHLPAGEVIMTIPHDLVLSSTMLSQHLQDQVVEIYTELGYDKNSFPAGTFLMLVVLKEKQKGTTSKWYNYFQSIPTTSFNNSLFWDEKERAYARKLGLGGIIDALDKHYDDFKQTVKQLLPEDYSPGDEEAMIWAFSVVTQRAWGTSFATDEGNPTVNLVCLGDLFNHARNGTVSVDHQHSGGSVMIRIDSPSPQAPLLSGPLPLYMNYFGTGSRVPNAPKCVSQYGFCEKFDVPAFGLMSQIGRLFENASGEYKRRYSAMGFDQHNDLVYYSNGTISECLWNAALCLELRYMLTEARVYHRDTTQGKPKYNMTELLPDLRLCEDALTTIGNNAATSSTGLQVEVARKSLASLHDKYRPEVSKLIQQDVQMLLNNAGGLSEQPNDKDGDLDHQHCHWGLLQEWHEHLLNTLHNVQSNLAT